MCACERAWGCRGDVRGVRAVRKGNAKVASLADGLGRVPRFVFWFWFVTRDWPAQ